MHVYRQICTASGDQVRGPEVLGSTGPDRSPCYALHALDDHTDVGKRYVRRCTSNALGCDGSNALCNGRRICIDVAGIAQEEGCMQV